MGNIGDYLKKFSNLISHKKEEIQFVIHFFEDNALPITEKDFEIKDNILILSVKPIVKSEIYVRKEYIVKQLQKRGVNIIDIRFR